MFIVFVKLFFCTENFDPSELFVTILNMFTIKWRKKLLVKSHIQEKNCTDTEITGMEKKRCLNLKERLFLTPSSAQHFSFFPEKNAGI